MKIFRYEILCSLIFPGLCIIFSTFLIIFDDFGFAYSFFVYHLSLPASYIISAIIEKLGINCGDICNMIIYVLCGTIQYGIVVIIISRIIKKRKSENKIRDAMIVDILQGDKAKDSDNK